jgi:hypothetical protein
MDGSGPTVHKVIKAWMKGGMPANKINLVLASIGRTFKLKNPTDNKLGAVVTGPGDAGMYTKSKGVLAYYEICARNWTNVTLWKNSLALTPYASEGNLWVGYDDMGSMRYKVEKIVLEMNLNGITFWALDWDDFAGKMCKSGKFPLLNEVKKALTPPPDCSTDPCKNGGECYNEVDGYACECKPGFIGENCQYRDFCAMNPCMNNGTCINKPENFQCDCVKPYTGNTCTDCAKDHTICSLFDDPVYYCSHVWMMANCAKYCGTCPPKQKSQSMMKKMPSR